jgi:hypothetical protein
MSGVARFLVEVTRADANAAPGDETHAADELVAASGDAAGAQAAAADDGWTVRVTGPDERPVGKPRQLRRIETDRGGAYPAPPLSELAGDPVECDLCSASDPDAVADVYRRLVDRRWKDHDIESFGRFLFVTLLGKSTWTDITAAVAGSEADTIELALSWPADEYLLHRLNWEMMRAPNGFLAAGGAGLRVAVTRLVPVGENAKAPQELRLPPRVLFVVGTSLTDPVIRPGAEYLNLLRQLKQDRRGIHARLLERASPKSLGTAIERFRPQVVHFICHGGTERGRGYLMLTPDQPELRDDGRRFGDQLVELLRAAGELPPIVVLSACHSGGGEDNEQGGRARMLGAHETAPLAAELAMSGIPVVIGMAGRVSDLACRLFTRRFGAAIVQGEPLVAAVAQARRAAFAEGVPPHKTPDWALPAVFLATNVPPSYTPVSRVQVQDPEDYATTVIKKMSLEEAPVFCGREEFFQRCDALLERGAEFAALAVVAQSPLPGYGRSRLLKELAAQALRDGNVPLLLSPDRGHSPATVRDLAEDMDAEILALRRLLGLKLGTGQLRLLRHYRVDKPDPHRDDYIQTLLDGEPLVTDEAFAEAIKLDLVALARDARDGNAHVRNEKGRVLVLVDDVDAYPVGIIELLFNGRRLIGHYGLGTADEWVPVVIAFSLPGKADHVLRPIWDDRAQRPFIEFRTLEPFRSDGEDMLAYERVLLHPFNKELYAPVSERPWALNSEVDETLQAKWTDRFRRRLAGLPIKFARSDVLYALAEDAKDDLFVIDADDDIWLQKVMGGNDRPR